jgi:hypothetical protein
MLAVCSLTIRKKDDESAGEELKSAQMPGGVSTSRDLQGENRTARGYGTVPSMECFGL